MPELAAITPQMLANIVGMSLEDLVRLSRAAHKLYVVSKIPKKTGEARTIEAPFKRLKSCQRTINSKVLGLIPVHHSLHGRPETSQLTAASKHTEQPVVVTMDVKDFFPSVSSDMVERSLAKWGIPNATVQLITKLCTRRKRLPQGAPTSPSIGRIVISPVLADLEKLFTAVSPYCRLTQFVDDLTISGPAGIQRLIPAIHKIWKRYGFTVHPAKTKVMLRSGQQEVLGVLVNDGIKPTEEFLGRLTDARLTLSPNDPYRLGLESWHRDIRRHGA